MIRRPTVALACAALVAAIALTLAGCGPATYSGMTSPTEGVVVDVDSAGLADVTGFTIRTGDGREIVFGVGDLENAADFPPAHLGEHLSSGVPVTVWFRTEANGPVAYRIEDAGS